MANNQPIKIQLRCRTKWWQFWLPEHVTIAMDSAPFVTLARTTKVLQAQVTDLGDMVIVLTDELAKVRSTEKLAKEFADHTVPLQPLSEPEQPKQIPVAVIEEADEDESVGYDFVPEAASNVVEFDRDASPSWTPDQSGGVVVKQPPIINQMRNQARNDLRKLQQ